MLKHVTSVLLLTLAVRGDSSFIFPDEVSTKYNSGSRYHEDARENRPSGYDRNHGPKYSGHYHGNSGGIMPGFGHHNGYDNRPVRPEFPDYGGSFSQSQANAQATGSGSLASSHSGSQSFNQGSQSSAQAQAQLQGYQQEYPIGASGGFGASSASSAASATSGIINGFAVSSASAAAASAGRGEGVVSSVSASSSSSFGIPSGLVTRPDKIPPWYFRTRVAGGDADGEHDDTDASSTHVKEATIVFSVK